MHSHNNGKLIETGEVGPIGTIEENTLCELRLELGAVLTKESELRAKERKHKMTMMRSPIVCIAENSCPNAVVLDRLFAASSNLAATNTTNNTTTATAPTCISVRANEYATSSISTAVAIQHQTSNAGGTVVFSATLPKASKELPLWRLAQQSGN